MFKKSFLELLFKNKCFHRFSNIKCEYQVGLGPQKVYLNMKLANCKAFVSQLLWQTNQADNCEKICVEFLI